MFFVCVFVLFMVVCVCVRARAITWCVFACFYPHKQMSDVNTNGSEM